MEQDIGSLRLSGGKRLPQGLGDAAAVRAHAAHQRPDTCEEGAERGGVDGRHGGSGEPGQISVTR